MTPIRSLILRPHEVRAALRGDLRLVVRPILHKHAFKTLNTGPDGGKVYQGPANIPDNEVSEAIPWLEKHSPLGVPGTVLRCREKCAIEGMAVWYAADCDKGPAHDVCEWPDGSTFEGRWRSPATMPAWASRITMVNETVGVCRLDSLTEDEARLCGLPPNWCGDLAGWSAEDHGYLPANWTRKMEDDYGFWTALDSLESHWNARYAAKGLGLDSNPWVWKCEVKGVEK